MMQIHTPSWPIPAAALACAALLAGCGSSGNGGDACEVVTASGTVQVGSGLPGDPAAPEVATGYRAGMKPVVGRRYMVVTANPLASKAGCAVLKDGGSAVDAAIAAQAVLGLVEPQSSGLGGGAFMLHYDAAAKKVVAYDGRETAPAAATVNYLRWIDDATNQTAPVPSARASGRSIGTPGVMRMLELAHREHGQKPWKTLFDDGIKLANDGFAISGRMAAAIDASKTSLARDADAAAAYLNTDGSAKALGSRFTLPAYAATLQSIAAGGADALYRGPIAQAIVDKIAAAASADGAQPITPGKTTLADLDAYQPKKRDAVCTTYRAHWVCGMPPPSSGGITVAAALGILENFDLAAHKPTGIDGEGGKPTVTAVHLVAEAERLAYADRDKYIADTDFIPLPGGSPDTLLNKPYLQGRAALISPTQSMGTATAGNLGAVPWAAHRGEGSGTTQITVADARGNVVSMTTTVESAFGSYHMTNGFILNNQLTDFSANPGTPASPVANKIEAGKRPRSSMAPTLVFNKAGDGGIGDFALATGSPGGSTIIQFVVKTLVGALDWGLDAQQATSLVDFGAANSPTTNVGGEHPAIDASANGANDALVTGLRALGHTVSVAAQSSGIGTIRRIPGALPQRPLLEGGADPRREGLVLGDGEQR